MIYWIIFVLISSIIEAVLFHFNRFKFKYNHFVLTLIRGCVCVPLALFSEYLEIFILFCLFTFPFLHDGIYYTFRNLMNKDVYPKRWIDKSKTTTAIISLSFFWRLILFIFGIGLIPLFL